MKKQIFRVLCVIISVLVVAMSMPVGVFAAEEVYCESFEIYVDSLGEKLYCEYYNLYAGDQLWLGCTPYPEDAVFNGELIYSGTDSDIAEVSVDGLVIAKAAGSITVTAQCGDISDQITINVTEKEKIIFGETYNSVLNENNLGEYVGTFMAPVGGQDYKITYSATAEITVQILNEYGDYIIGKSGTDGIIRCWLSDSFAHQVVVISNNIKEEISFDFTVEPYTPVQRLEITDQEGNDFSDYNAEVGETISLGCNIHPDGAVSNILWSSDNSDVAQVDEQGNVTVINAGDTHIRVYALDDDGNIIDYLTDELYIYAEKITNVDFGNSYYITITERTEKLRVVAPYNGYFYIRSTGNDIDINITVTKTSDNSMSENRPEYISDIEFKNTVILEKDAEYIISFSAPYGNGYTVEIGGYPVPENLYITDNYGNIKTEYTGYIGEVVSFNSKYDVEDCYNGAFEWKSSDESVAVVDGGGYVNFLSQGSATITVTSEIGLTASVQLTVIDGKPIALNTPLTETLSYSGNTSVRFKFIPNVTSVYKISAENISGGEIFLNFYVTDSSYNEIPLILNDVEQATVKLESGNTYYIKAIEQGMGGEYNFTLTNESVAINSPISLSMPEGNDQYIDYYFIPEKTGYYLFKTSGYVDDGWGRGVDVYNDMGEIISDFTTEDNSSLSYASLTAGNVYRIHIFKYYWDAAVFTFEITETVGIASMEILTMPTNSTIASGSSDFDFSGLSLRVTTSDGDTATWNYNDSPQKICGFLYSHSSSEEIDGIKNVYIKAGGAVCTVPYTVKALEALTLNNPIEITYGTESDSERYKFIPETTGWYRFATYNHTVKTTDRSMDLYSDNEWISNAVRNMNGIELYGHLTAGKTYTLHTYKNHWESDTFNLCVTQVVGIESITVKQNPVNMTVKQGHTYHPDFSGLVLTVTTSDGQIRDWTYTTGAESILGYTFENNVDEYEDTVLYTIKAGGSRVMLRYTLLPYELVRVEAITAGDIIIIENIDGHDDGTGFRYNLPISKVMVKLVYNDGTVKFANINDTIDGFDVWCTDNQYENPWTVGGDNYFTVGIFDKSVDVPVKIVKSELSGIEVINDGNLTVMDGMGSYMPVNDDEYIWYYGMDLSDVRLKISFTDGTYQIAGVHDVVRGKFIEYLDDQEINPIIAGKDNYITLVYDTESVKLPVTVLESNIEKVTLTKTPTKPYIYGDPATGMLEGDIYYLYPSLTDGYEFTVKYDDGREITVSAEDYENGEFDGYYPQILCDGNITGAGTKEIIFVWGGTIINFDVEIIESDVEKIEVLELPTIPENLEYFPTMAGITIKITYTDGETKIVTLAENDIEYAGESGIFYTAQIDGSELSIMSYSNDDYVVRYRGKEASFSLSSEYSFSVYNVDLVYFDNVNQSVTVSYIYSKNGAEEEKILELDLSKAEKRIYDNSVWYGDVIKTEKGIYSYSFSYSLRENGHVECYFNLLKSYFNGNLVETAGDINGDGSIDVRDLVRMKKLAADNSENTVARADFDGDSRNSATDVAYLRKGIFGSAILSIVYGDADGNGYVENYDALAIAAYIAGSNEILSSRADVNNDGVIDQTDLDLINSML